MSNTEGWTWLVKSTKWHYLRDGKSLCGKWTCQVPGVLEQGQDDAPDNCAACRKKLKKEYEKQNKLDPLPW